MEKRIRYEQAIVVLAMMEVLTEDFSATCSLGGSQDSGIPVGNLETFLDRMRRLKDGEGILLDAETEPLLNQTGSNVVGQRVGASPAFSGFTPEGRRPLPTREIRLVLRLLTFLLLVGSAWGQPWSVSRSVRQAFDQNPEFRARQAEVRQLSSTLEQAGSLPNGLFTAGASRGQGQAALTSISGLPRDEYLQFLQPFQPFGARSKAQEVALLNLQEAQSRLQLAQVQLMRKTKDAFYGLLAIQVRLKVLESNLRLATEILHAAEKNLKGKKGSRKDVLAARVQANQVEQSVVQAQGERLGAQAELCQLLGLPPGAPLVVEGQLDTQSETLTLEQVLALGARSPALQAARQAASSAREQVHLTALQGNPFPSLSVLYDFRIPSYIVGAQLSMPLDWGQIGYEVQAREELAKASEARLSTAELEVLRDIHKAHALFVAGVRNSASYEHDVLQPEEEAVRLTQESYQKREVDYDQLLLAQQQLESIRVEYIQQQLAERLALNALEEAVGAPIEPLSEESTQGSTPACANPGDGEAQPQETRAPGGSPTRDR